MRIKSKKILALVLFLILISCDKKRVFDQYKSVGNAWNKDNFITFNLPELDSTKTYNLFVNLRTNDSYKFNNIFLVVALESKNGFTKIDTLEYAMATRDGNLLGNGFTDLKESKLFYKENYKIKGKQKVTIKQMVRENGKITGVKALEGITDVGFRIEKIN